MDNKELSLRDGWSTNKPSFSEQVGDHFESMPDGVPSMGNGLTSYKEYLENGGTAALANSESFECDPTQSRTAAEAKQDLCDPRPGDDESTGEPS